LTAGELRVDHDRVLVRSDVAVLAQQRVDQMDLQPLRPAEEREVCELARLLRQPEDLLEPSSALLRLLAQVLDGGVAAGAPQRRGQAPRHQVRLADHHLGQPPGGGKTAIGLVVLSPPGAAFGVEKKPNCVFTGCTTGVVMLPILSVPLVTSLAEHAAKELPPDAGSELGGSPA
jgi:hypothetical protein